MKKSSIKALTLRSETVRALDRMDLTRAGGAMANNTRSGCVGGGCGGGGGGGGAGGGGETSVCTQTSWCNSVWVCV